MALRQAEYGSNLDLLVCSPFSKLFCLSIMVLFLIENDGTACWGDELSLLPFPLESPRTLNPRLQDWVALSTYETSLTSDLAFCPGNKGPADYFIVELPVNYQCGCEAKKEVRAVIIVSMALTVSWPLWWLFSSQVKKTRNRFNIK